MRQATRPTNQDMTYGYYRAGILAALINGISLILITVWILGEAFQRFQHPEPVDSTWMFVSASEGLVMNLYLGLGMRKVDNINIQSAVLHMLGDAVASAGVIIGGVVIALTKWYVVDPILSVLIAILIAFGVWRLANRQANHFYLNGRHTKRRGFSKCCSKYSECSWDFRCTRLAHLEHFKQEKRTFLPRGSEWGHDGSGNSVRLS